MEKDKKNNNGIRRAALEYHSRDRKGKLEVIAAKPCTTQWDLSLAYTPGVAEPCMEIFNDPAMARMYTTKGNLVAVVTNGTAVLGLGDIGPLASKPVMEGKAVLFKRFADVDVFDIELDTHDPDEIIQTVKHLAPTFGGINLEDIKAPECFYIEEKLKEMLDIPVFHDDQHGTAIISGAALINALDITGKNIKKVKVVFSGAGAAGIACANFYITLGVKPENVLMTDSKGVLWKGRGDEGKNKYKDAFFRETKARTLADAMMGADVFCGVSMKGVLKQEMVKTMADKPIIFAMANPDPEITYEDALEARPDALIATGRSDYPNQVNNVLGFPFIFRGALDVEASAINEEMKMAVAQALAKLAREEVPDSVKKAYDDPDLTFGPEYIIPKPFDPRVLYWAATAVADAAMRSGVARKQVDLDEYREHLMEKLDWSREIMRKIFVRARKAKKRILFPEGMDPKVIWAASEIVREGIAKPVLLGRRKEEMLALFEELHHSPEGIEFIEPKAYIHRQQFVDAYYKMGQRKGITLERANLDLRNYYYFGSMMVREGHVDGMVAGATSSFYDVLKPVQRIIGPKADGRLIAGMYLLNHENKQYCLADCTVNIYPDPEELAEIALLSASEMEYLGLNPRIAMLSFSNFGSYKSEEASRVTQAVKIIHKKRPDLMADGPVQADFALDPDFMKKHFPFSDLKARPNLLVFPSLDSGNISLKLLRKLSHSNTVGPIMIGLARPIQILPRGAEINTIINLTAIACVDAQNLAVKASQYIREFA